MLEGIDVPLNVVLGCKIYHSAVKEPLRFLEYSIDFENHQLELKIVVKSLKEFGSDVGLWLGSAPPHRPRHRSEIKTPGSCADCFCAAIDT